MYKKKEITSDTIFVDGKEYRYVELRGRGKYIARDGAAINPFRNQKATIHYNSDGYPCYGGGVPVHLYVATAWVDGWFEGAEVNHKDFNLDNYNADNLEWVTHEENIAYSIQYNKEAWHKAKEGTNNGRAKFSVEDVLKIRRMYDSGMSIADIIREFYPDLIHASQYKNIHSNITNIAKRRTWKCVPEEEPEEE